MATRIAKRLASVSGLEASVAGLKRLEVITGAASAPGATSARNFARKFVPAIRFSNPEASVVVAPPAADAKPRVVAAFEGGKTKEFDPSKARDAELFAHFLGIPWPPAGSAAASGATDSAAPAAAAADAAAPADPRLPLIASAVPPVVKGRGTTPKQKAVRRARSEKNKSKAGPGAQ